MTAMLSIFRAALGVLVVSTILLGVVYPMAITGIAQAIFPHKANGSLIVQNEKVIGSELLGQDFSNEWYFWGRLSATTPPYNPAMSAGSNLGPSNPKLMDQVLGRARELQKVDPQNKQRIPIDLVTASGSGLDPHITVESANYQLFRVAQARHISPEILKRLIAEHTEQFAFGKIVPPYVNVVKLNLALDAWVKERAKK